MKTSLFLACLCALLGCTTELSSRPVSPPLQSETQTDVPSEEDAGDAAPLRREWSDAGVALPIKRGTKHDYKVIAVAPKPVDAGTGDAGKADAGMDEDASADDAGTGGEPTIDAGPPREGPLRNLSMRLSGMEHNLHHFAQFRLANPQREFHIMFVIHEGLTSGTYEWELPNALFTDESYTLDFFIDHDETTGPAFYDPPPVDHSWSIPIPAGEGDVMIDFPFNTDFTDIEDIAPTPFRSTVLHIAGLSEYGGELIDVRVIDRGTGRLVGRQVREIPGDTFDVTVGSTTHPSVEYQVDVSVDADGNGRYNHPTDPSWRVFGTADATGMHPSIDASSATQTDVQF
jgi:hypothetical protein